MSEPEYNPIVRIDCGSCDGAFFILDRVLTQSFIAAKAHALEHGHATAVTAYCPYCGAKHEIEPELPN